MKLVGITGSIGAGKSTVAAYLRAEGFKVINLDEIGHDLIKPGLLAYDEILAIWPSVKAYDGTIDRKLLGQIVFSDPGAKSKLDAIMIPKIKEAAANQIAASPHEPLIFIDGALVVEFEMNKGFSDLIVVMCSRETQIERIRARDGLTTVEAIDRINGQLSQKEKLKHATAVIYNDTTADLLIHQIKNIVWGLHER
jgi:dephospho-CoA kinase